MKYTKPKDFKPEQHFPGDHPRWANKQRCTAWNVNHGRQCGKPAMIGKTKCERCGGKSLSGISSPGLKTGRYSKYIPAQLAARYDEARSDPDILSLNEDVALLRSLVFKHLSSISAGDTHPAWIEAHKAFMEMDRASSAGELDKFLAAKARLGAVIEPNYRAAIAEGKVAGYIDQLGRIADKERRLLIDRQQVITVERMMIMITAIASIVKQNIDDRDKLNAIQNGIQRLIVSGVDSIY